MKFEKCTFPITRIHKITDEKDGTISYEYSLAITKGYSFEINVPYDVQHRFWRCEESQRFFVYKNYKAWNVTCPITGACIIYASTRKSAVEKFENVAKEKYFTLLRRNDFEKLYKKQIDAISVYYKGEGV